VENQTSGNSLDFFAALMAENIGIDIPEEEEEDEE
jgi:hypothetical protein